MGAGYKDTFSLDSTLRPIIAAGLVKFRDVLRERDTNGKTIGVPSYYYDPAEDSCTLWLEILDKMVYSFTANEPEMEEFGVSLEWEFIDLPESNPSYVEAKSMKVTYLPSEEAYKVYSDAVVEHNKRLEEGYKLFGENYSNLWW